MKARMLMATVLFLLLIGPAIAQSSWDTAANVDVPFEFVVNGTTLPAGHYIVRTHGTGRFVLLQNTETKQVVISSNRDIILNPNTTQESSRLVFALDNGQQVLHQICISGDNHTHDLIHGANVAELVSTR